MMTSALLALAAVLLDWLLGEPRRRHPLVGFGSLADQLERKLYGDATITPRARRRRGILALLLLLLPFTAAAAALTALPYAGTVFARPGLIVLRSLGKFFGLAGARVGFVCAHPTLLMRLHTVLGPWTVNAPARWIATAALNDRPWQTDTQQRLMSEGTRLGTLLARHGLGPEGGCALFQWLRTPHAQALHEALARHGILTRLFTEPTSLRFGRSRHPVSRDTCASLRFGLPGTEADWARLDSALTHTATDNARAVT